MRDSIAALVIAGFFLYSCSPRTAIQKELIATEKKQKSHTGFILFDPRAQKSLLEYHSDKYFTPASNTKILTFYTALEILGDSIPALKYSVRNDSLFFQGLGDPSFLYSNVKGNDRVFNFLKEQPYKLFFSSSNFKTDRFGPGWPWDDYNYAFSPERSPFPMFGNCMKLFVRNNDVSTIPRYFSSNVVKGDSLQKARAERELDSDRVTFFPGKKLISSQKWEIPFRYSDDLLVELLSDTLSKSVEVYEEGRMINSRIVYSVPADSLYKVMMQESDNLIAEQLLLMCAGVVSDTLKPEIAIRYMKKNFLSNLSDKISWVDGSGLSRYNLATPRSLVDLWRRIQTKIPKERLFNVLAVGGKSGTLTNWYKADIPYVYAKTGTLTNNHNLSGFIVTRSGKILIFSFMNNNFMASVSEVREAMQRILIIIRDRY